MDGVPEEIAQCSNLELRERGIAACSRGSLQERNQALLDCVRFNQAHQTDRHHQERQAEFEKWKVHLTQSASYHPIQ